MISRIAKLYRLLWRPCLLWIALLPVLKVSVWAVDKTSPEVKQALDWSLTLKIEMAVDLGFVLLDSGLVSADDAAKYLELLYTRAGEARRKFPTIWVPRRAPETKSSQFSQVLSEFGFDATGIRVKILRRLAKSDIRKARDLWQSTSYEPLPISAACDETEIPYVGEGYYETLVTLFPIQLDVLLEQIATPQQGASILNAIGKPGIAEDQREAAVVKVAQVLTTAATSDRVFTTTELRLKLGETIEGLLSSGTIPPSSRHIIAKAYIEYVDRHLRGTRCPDVRNSAK